MKIRVPATTANLGAGFDCLGLALDLWLHVEAKYNTPDIKVITTGQGGEYLPQNERNYFIRTINAILRKWQMPPLKGINLFVNNEIPLSRGLGSSAAVTVAAVKIASQLANKRVSSREAINIAGEIEGHADNVAAAYYGGLILTGMVNKEGYQVINLPLKQHVPLALVAIPNYRMRTADARAVLPRKVTLRDAVYNNSRTGLAVYAWTSGEYRLLKTAMQDRLHQFYRIGIMAGAKEMLAMANCCNNNYGAALSGSGSTLIAFGEKKGLTELRTIWQNIWAKHSISGTIKIIKISREGVSVEL